MDSFPMQLPNSVIYENQETKDFHSSTGDTKPARHTDVTEDIKSFTLEELRQYNGTSADGRILLALLGKVYDVTTGSKFYGPGGAYAVFAGRDATLGLASFNMKVQDCVCDPSLLDPRHLEHAKRWQALFEDKYPVVGVLEASNEPRPLQSAADTQAACSATEGTQRPHRVTFSGRPHGLRTSVCVLL